VTRRRPRAVRRHRPGGQWHSWVRVCGRQGNGGCGLCVGGSFCPCKISKVGYPPIFWLSPPRGSRLSVPLASAEMTDGESVGITGSRGNSWSLATTEEMPWAQCSFLEAPMRSYFLPPSRVNVQNMSDGGGGSMGGIPILKALCGVDCSR
jgi:hypothetical protein